MALFLKKSPVACDIDIVGCTKRYITAAFGAIERKSPKTGTAVKEDKTKYTLSTSRGVLCVLILRLRPITIIFM